MLKYSRNCLQNFYSYESIQTTFPNLYLEIFIWNLLSSWSTQECSREEEEESEKSILVIYCFNFFAFVFTLFNFVKFVFRWEKRLKRVQIN